MREWVGRGSETEHEGSVGKRGSPLILERAWLSRLKDDQACVYGPPHAVLSSSINWRLRPEVCLCYVIVANNLVGTACESRRPTINKCLCSRPTQLAATNVYVFVAYTFCFVVAVVTPSRSVSVWFQLTKTEIAEKAYRNGNEIMNSRNWHSQWNSSRYCVTHENFSCSYWKSPVSDDVLHTLHLTSASTFVIFGNMRRTTGTQPKLQNLKNWNWNKMGNVNHTDLYTDIVVATVSGAPVLTWPPSKKTDSFVMCVYIPHGH